MVSRTGAVAWQPTAVRPGLAAGHGGWVVDDLGRRGPALDELTGLPGRCLFEGRLTEALEQPGHGVGLLLVGLDRFSSVNYRLGRDGGDEVLRRTAARLGSAVGSRGRLHRIGGDEFAVLVTDVRHPGDLRALAAALLREVRHPLSLDRATAAGPGRDTVSTTVSVGIACTVRDAAGQDEDGRHLLREAELALHRAKDHGRDRVVVFDEQIRRGAESAMATERRLRHALAEGRMQMYLQPIVDLADDEPVAYEGLARMVDAAGTVVLPGNFMEVAEDRGLVSDIDRWGIARAAALLAADVAPAVAVNLSARTFDRIDVVGRVAAALGERGVDPARLHLEVTETSIALSERTVVAALTALRGYGCHVAIDDFGTGYSSLAHLGLYPADALKIDMSFVAALGRGPGPDAVVQAAITLGHAHGMTVVAEGVERRDQADALRRMGCDLAQGWLYGRPADPGAV